MITDLPAFGKKPIYEKSEPNLEKGDKTLLERAFSRLSMRSRKGSISEPEESTPSEPTNSPRKLKKDKHIK